MAEEPENTDEGDKAPLEYRNYSDDLPERRKNIRAMISGAVNGILLVGFSGCFGALSMPETNATARSREAAWLAKAFGCVAVAAGVLGAASLRGPRRRFWLAGFLLGVAMTSLLEGFCFLG